LKDKNQKKCEACGCSISKDRAAVFLHCVECEKGREIPIRTQEEKGAIQSMYEDEK